MRQSYIYLTVLCLLALLAYAGCRKKAPPPTVVQPQPTLENQQSHPSIEITDSVKPGRLLLPKIFVKSLDKQGQPVFTQVGGSADDRSEYHAFPKYDVMTTSIPGVAGDRIDVFRHILVQTDTLVLTQADSIIFTVGTMGTWFDRLIDDFLVITITTGPGPAGLWVYDLVSQKRTCNLTYRDDSRAWDGFLLTSWEPIDSVATSENCPESKVWLAEGLGAGFEEQFIVDLRTCAERNLSKFRCVPLQ